MILVDKNDLNNHVKICELLKYKRFRIKDTLYVRETLEYLMCDVEYEMVRKVMKYLGFCNSLFLYKFEEYCFLAYINIWGLDIDKNKVKWICNHTLPDLINYDGSRQFIDILLYMLSGIKTEKYEIVSEIGKVKPKNAWQISKSLGNETIPPYIFLQTIVFDEKINDCIEINETNVEKYKFKYKIVYPVMLNRDKERYIIDCVLRNNTGKSMEMICNENKPDDLWVCFDDLMKLVRCENNNWTLHNDLIYKNGKKFEIEADEITNENYCEYYDLYKFLENNKEFSKLKTHISNKIIESCYLK